MRTVSLVTALTGCAGSSDVSPGEPDVKVTVIYYDAAPARDSKADVADSSAATVPVPDSAPDSSVTSRDIRADGGVADTRAPLDSLDASVTKADGSTRDQVSPPDSSSDASAQRDAPWKGDSPDGSFVSVDSSTLDTGTCERAASLPLAPRSARSFGYSGAATAYEALSAVECPGDLQTEACARECMEAGGSADSCNRGSRCEKNGAVYHCLPPIYWRDASLALSEDGAAGSAILAIARASYADGLVFTDFGAQVPSDATITGIEFRVAHTADVTDAVFDETNLVVQGTPVGEHRIGDLPWGPDRSAVMYGGPSDTWELDLTPALVNAPGFGMMIAARYVLNSGSANAYLHQVRMVVHYQHGCVDY